MFYVNNFYTTRSNLHSHINFHLCNITFIEFLIYYPLFHYYVFYSNQLIFFRLTQNTLSNTAWTIFTLETLKVNTKVAMGMSWKDNTPWWNLTVPSELWITLPINITDSMLLCTKRLQLNNTKNWNTKFIMTNKVPENYLLSLFIISCLWTDNVYELL